MPFPTSELQLPIAVTNQRKPRSLFELLFGVSTSLVAKKVSLTTPILSEHTPHPRTYFCLNPPQKITKITWVTNLFPYLQLIHDWLWDTNIKPVSVHKYHQHGYFYYIPWAIFTLEKTFSVFYHLHTQPILHSNTLKLKNTKGCPFQQLRRITSYKS